MSDNDLQIPGNIAGVILHKLGVVEGKLDKIALSVADIWDDNVKCREDRDDLKAQIGTLRSNQYWFAGAAAGVSVFLSQFFHMFGLNLPPK